MFKHHRKQSTAFLLWLFVIASSNGCGDPSQPPPKTGVSNWRPRSLGGPLEVRPLPPSNKVLADWANWRSEDLSQKGRVYETTLSGASNQTAFTVDVRRTDTPLGRPEHTYVSFLYKDPTNGVYELLWHRLGRHTGEYLKLGDRPKVVWLRPNELTNQQGIPQLQIQAFEGLEPGPGIIAEAGRKSE